MRILIVDDSAEVTRRLGTLLLAIEGVDHVDTATGRVAALGRCRSSAPDLVILDIRLADGSGLDLLAAMRAEAIDVPVIMLTNDPDPAVRERCRQLGAQFFFDKSTEFDRVPGVVEDAISRRDAVAAAAGSTCELERLNRELTEREARLRAILDTEPECVKLVAVDGSVLEMNAAGLRMLEAESLDDLIDRPLQSLVAIEHREAFGQLAEQVFSGVSGALEFKVEGLRGGQRWLETHAAPLRDRTGAVTALLGVTRDITERKRSQEVTRTNERRYLRQRDALVSLTRHAVDYEQGLGPALERIARCAARTLGVARVSIWRCNDDCSALHCVQIHDLAGDRLGAPGEVLTAVSCPSYMQSLAQLEMIVADDVRTDPRTSGLDEGYLRPLGITATMNVPIQVFGALDGVIAHEHTGAPRRWTEDEQVFALAMANLVSLALEGWDRYRTETALSEAQARLQRAASAGNVGLWEWDLRRHHLHYSPEVMRQLGYAADDSADDVDVWRRRLHPDDRDRAVQALRACLDNPGPLVELEARLCHRNGSYRHILLRASLQRDEAGLPARILGSNVDITDYVDLQARFLQAQKMESVGQLAGGLAHDFNNLLTVINGTAELALDGLRSEDPMRVDLQQMLVAGDRAASLTRQLLAFSRKQLMKPEVLDLGVVVADMQEMLQRLIGERLELVIRPAPALGAVRADRGQVEQIVMNLAVNARDAMPGGGLLTIETSNVELDAEFALDHPSMTPGPHVLLAVTDTGTGIDAATRARIFEPFFTTKEVAKGTGLGLSTVYGIVKQSGGTVWVYSELGRGTTFKIYLPRVDAQITARPRARQEAAARGHETVLVVEDDDAVRRLASRMLQSAGYHVTATATGPDALEMLERLGTRVDLLLTDVVLPGLTGRELAECASRLRPGIAVLYTSGYTDDTIVRHGVIDETAHFISKPYTARELTRAVRKVLDTGSP